MKEQAAINPIESQREEALKHYQEVSSAAHHWSSFVEAAIKAYNPPEPPQGKTMEDVIGGLFNDGDILTASRIIKLIKSAMSEWASIQTADLQKQLREQMEHAHQLFGALEELVQLKEWKDKHGKDEHYLKHQPMAWVYAQSLIQKHKQ